MTVFKDSSLPGEPYGDSAARDDTSVIAHGVPRLVGGPGGDPGLHVSMATLIELLGGATQGPSSVEAERFAVRRVARGATAVHEGTQACTLFVVQTGSFKCVKTADDGYEHVLGFAWRGDVMGFDGVGCAQYAFGAVALEDSRVVALPLAGLEALRHRVRAFDAALLALLARQLTHAGEIAEVMASVAADVRLARFLVQMSGRMAARGQSPYRLLLRMSRRDIANHLGVAHETISRSLRVLIDEGWLRVHDRDVEILDLDGLKRCARCARLAADRAAMAQDEQARRA
jgi:CRP/FNR family transcriptional regulator